MSSRIRRKKIVGLYSELWFGLYKGITVKEAVDLNMRYVEWMIKELKGLEFDKECRSYILEKKIEISREYYRNNPIKL